MRRDQKQEYVVSGAGTTAPDNDREYVPCFSLPFPVLHKVRSVIVTWGPGNHGFHRGLSGLLGRAREVGGEHPLSPLQSSSASFCVQYWLFCPRFSFNGDFRAFTGWDPLHWLSSEGPPVPALSGFIWA